MILELLLFGLITGFTAGFFGIGGGMVLVPMLLFAGFAMKEAIAISIVQMVFSSIFGSFLNVRKQLSIVLDGLLLGIGGFIGGLCSGFIVNSLSNDTLQYLFIAILFISVLKVFKTNVEHNDVVKSQNKLFLVLIGMSIGMFAMSIGVGGSIMLTPLLISFMRYDIKVATTLGLFFVMFSSVAGFISLSYSNQMLYQEGITVGLTSLIGVYFGIKVKQITHVKSYKNLVLGLYIIILFFMLQKVFF
jgi:uncharacterized membrane protein YfcA